ncbi:MAG TPA: hypothetical protein VE222_05285 [Nitrospiraceae bacterium]|nr:hypothetical protein [Nitrospiraceae bacterium]
MQKTMRDSLRPKIPPAILIVGSLAGKLMSWLLNIDFIMSIKNQTFLLLFGWLISYGWWFMAAVGVIWVFKARGTKVLGPGLVTVVGVLAFVWGILLTVIASSSVPRIIISWGDDGTACSATFDTSRLSHFRKKYNIVLVCGILDPQTDRLQEKRISISSPFNIHPVGVFIEAPHSKEMASAINPETLMSYWHEAALIPKGTVLSSIHSLSDITKYGGKILDQAYFE